MSARRPIASDAVRGEWLRRIEAEYRSASITQHLGLWMIQIAASPDLISASLRIVRDELAHARLSHRVYLAAGGQGGPVLARESLELRRSDAEALELDVAAVVVESFCLGETVAVPLFSAMRRGCTAPAARRALDRVLRDEVRHRDFGWRTLAWLLDQPAAPAIVGLIDAALPSMFRRLRSLYASAPDEQSLPDADRAWGLLPGARYAALLDRCAERDYLPRFARLGLDARPAWEASLGGRQPVREGVFLSCGPALV